MKINDSNPNAPAYYAPGERIPLNILPREMILNIFKLLDISTLKNISNTCKWLNQYVDSVFFHLQPIREIFSKKNAQPNSFSNTGLDHPKIVYNSVNNLVVHSKTQLYVLARNHPQQTKSLLALQEEVPRLVSVQGPHSSYFTFHENNSLTLVGKSPHYSFFSETKTQKFHVLYSETEEVKILDIATALESVEFASEYKKIFAKQHSSIVKAFHTENTVTCITKVGTILQFDLKTGKYLRGKQFLSLPELPNERFDLIYGIEISGPLLIVNGSFGVYTFNLETFNAGEVFSAGSPVRTMALKDNNFTIQITELNHASFMTYRIVNGKTRYLGTSVCPYEDRGTFVTSIGDFFIFKNHAGNSMLAFNFTTREIEKRFFATHAFVVNNFLITLNGTHLEFYQMPSLKKFDKKSLEQINSDFRSAEILDICYENNEFIILYKFNSEERKHVLNTLSFPSTVKEPVETPQEKEPKKPIVVNLKPRSKATPKTKKEPQENKKTEKPIDLKPRIKPNLKTQILDGIIGILNFLFTPVRWLRSKLGI